MIELQPFRTEDAQTLISKIKDERMLLQFAGPAYHFPLTDHQLEADLLNEKRRLFKSSIKQTVIPLVMPRCF